MIDDAAKLGESVPIIFIHFHFNIEVGNNECLQMSSSFGAFIRQIMTRNGSTAEIRTVMLE